MTTKFCVIPECDRALSPNSKLDACTNCRASMGMWRRRGVPAVLTRRANLKRYDCRMVEVLETSKIAKRTIGRAKKVAK